MGLALKLFLAFLSLCAVGTLAWLFIDIRRYIKRYVSVVLVLISIHSYAQNVDSEGCMVSFRWQEEPTSQLVASYKSLEIEFVPGGKSWLIKLKNQGSDEVQVNWGQAQFIVNGLSSSLAFYQKSVEEKLPVTTLQGGEEQEFEVTAAALMDGKRKRRIYDGGKMKPGQMVSVSIMLPLSHDGRRFFYKDFAFMVEKRR